MNKKSIFQLKVLFFEALFISMSLTCSDAQENARMGRIQNQIQNKTKTQKKNEILFLLENGTSVNVLKRIYSDIPRSTIQGWRNRLVLEGKLLPLKKQSPKNWTISDADQALLKDSEKQDEEN